MKMQNFYMQSAINEAKAVAVKAAGDKVTKDYLGIYVMEVQKNSKFKGKLKVGDTITKVNGRHFESAYGFQNYIRKQKVGKRLTVTYQRDGVKHTVTEPLIKLSSGQPGIGIILTDNVKIKTSPKVSVDPGQIGGPSGGLMMSLQIYTQLTNTNLRHGRKIAGTGTINPDGSVGEIGGIDKKNRGSQKSGRNHFLRTVRQTNKGCLETGRTPRDKLSNGQKDSKEGRTEHESGPCDKL
ncbi:PDZ domain-containing protein [Secundilactobacillus collinoides]|uniref:PDZ domain-containing protein n=1 Tax=Secundilactobacillus collinoides TaxID=33960 RepID=UPI000A5CB5E8|nr:PDZ domain-containing protein [Secundilactobacillus collinoides]